MEIRGTVGQDQNLNAFTLIFVVINIASRKARIGDFSCSGECRKFPLNNDEIHRFTLAEDQLLPLIRSRRLFPANIDDSVFLEGRRHIDLAYMKSLDDPSVS